MENIITIDVTPAGQSMQFVREFLSLRDCFLINFEFKSRELYYRTTIYDHVATSFKILRNCTREDHDHIMRMIFSFMPTIILHIMIPKIEECVRQMIANNSEGREILVMDVVVDVIEGEGENRNQSDDGQARQIVDLLEKLQIDYLPSDSSRQCSICLEEFCNTSDLVSTKCSHIFHEECIVLWIQKCIQRSSVYFCPLCRRQIP